MAAILDTMHASLIELTNEVQCLCQHQDGYDYAPCHNIVQAIYEKIMQDISFCISYLQELRNMFPTHRALTTKNVLDPNVAKKTTTVLQDLKWTILQIQNSMKKFHGERSYEVQVFMYTRSTQILEMLQCSVQQFQTLTVPTPEEKVNAIQTMLDEMKTNNQKLILDKYHCNKKNTDSNLKLVEMAKHVQETETINTELTRVNKELTHANKELTQQNIVCHEKLTTIEDSNMLLRKKLQEASITNMHPPTNENALRRFELPHMSLENQTYTKKTNKKFGVTDHGE